MEIQPGDRVLARTATDQWIPLRARTGVQRGQDFPILWLGHEDGDAAEAFAWPADAVKTYEDRT